MFICIVYLSFCVPGYTLNEKQRDLQICRQIMSEISGCTGSICICILSEIK